MRLLYYVKMIMLFRLIRCCFMRQCRLGNNIVIARRRSKTEEREELTTSSQDDVGGS